MIDLFKKMNGAKQAQPKTKKMSKAMSKQPKATNAMGDSNPASARDDTAALKRQRS